MPDHLLCYIMYHCTFQFSRYAHHFFCPHIFSYILHRCSAIFVTYEKFEPCFFFISKVSEMCGMWFQTFFFSFLTDENQTNDNHSFLLIISMLDMTAWSGIEKSDIFLLRQIKQHNFEILYMNFLRRWSMVSLAHLYL